MSPAAHRSLPVAEHLRPRDAIFDLLPHGVALADERGTVTATNPRWDRAGGDDDPVVAPVGANLIAHLRSPHRPTSAVADHIADGVTRLLDGRGSSFEVQYELLAPLDPTEARWFLVAAERLPTGGVVITRTETTVHHGVNEVLAELAFHDDLTGLPNRGLLMDRMRMALIRAQRLDLRPLIVFTDLDGFKAVNDEHGHEAGDAVLVEMAGRLSHTVREGDTCGRWGGDEFVLVVELGTRSATDRVIERIARTVEAPFELPDGSTCTLGISIGAVVADGGERVDALIDRADRAMYRAKREQAGPVIVALDED
ncbi:GGDEF domain-containing protein [Iamia sp.]|uniref:GGDEF domain-containing protein n=1 Tax=Iamia sp. TaxID=2722710 RepID=UPI002C76EF34|nr:GGDEF domain-containing protein [Iamia sp.]HXH59600.1 GGDEF domain-containing protein [Iamia sp.]